jgi:hypothetical protein
MRINKHTSLAYRPQANGLRLFGAGQGTFSSFTGPAAAFGPKRAFSSVEWVMKLISEKKNLQ